LWLRGRNEPLELSSDSDISNKEVILTFIDKSISAIAQIVKTNYVQWNTAETNGLFQRLDPRLKTVFLLFCVGLISAKKGLDAELIMTGFLFVLVMLSRLNLFRVYKRILFFGFFFGFLIAFPAAFNVITPGQVVLRVASLSRPHHFLIYTIPAEIGLTAEGCFGVAMLFLRVANSVAVVLLVLDTTHFFDFIRSLKILRIPDSFLMILMLTYKYAFILSRTIEDTYLAMKSRLVGSIQSSEIREIVSGRIFYVFKLSRMRYEETYKAMLARGFTGEVSLHAGRGLTGLDTAVGIVLAGVLIIIILL
jgi:cobalt/nickel transport system permease protein